MNRCQEIYDRIISKGRTTIAEFVADREAEDLFLDFKRSSDDGTGKKLSNNDRKNLAKAISGFGNSEGGVVVWGVDCSLDKDGADVARTEVFINNPTRFASLLQGAVSGCTVPPHSGVENHVIEVDEERGFVITLIPKSNSAPHQMLPNKQYYIRAGSDFIPTPHDVLSGMFGRRPQPHVFHEFVLHVPELVGNELKIVFELILHNEGPGIASDVFCTCLGQNLPGDNCQMKLELPDRTNWSGTFEFGRQVSLISAPGYRIPPGAKARPLIIDLSLIPPFEGVLNISGTVGSGESRRYEFIIERNAQEIQEQYELFVKKAANDSFVEGQRQDIGMAIIRDAEA